MTNNTPWYTTATILALILAALTVVVVTRPASRVEPSVDGSGGVVAGSSFETIDIPSPTLTLDPWMIDPTKPGWQDDKRWAGQPPPAIIPRIFPAHIQDNWPIPDLTNVIRARGEPSYTINIGGSWVYVHKDDDTPYYQRRRIIHVHVSYFHDSYPLKVEDFVNPKAVGKAYCGLELDDGFDTCLMVAQDCIIEFYPIGPWEGDVNAQMEQLMLELATELRKHFGTDDQ